MITPPGANHARSHSVQHTEDGDRRHGLASRVRCECLFHDRAHACHPLATLATV